MILLNVSDMENMLPVIVVAILSLVIFYFIIKSAVKGGMLSAHREIENDKYVEASVPENQRQQKLKSLYLRGRITFESFKEEWSK